MQTNFNNKRFDGRIALPDKRGRLNEESQCYLDQNRAIFLGVFVAGLICYGTLEESKLSLFNAALSSALEDSQLSLAQ